MFKMIRELFNRNEQNLKDEIEFLKTQLNLAQQHKVITEDKPCKSCETLKEQLTFSNNERTQLMETLIQLTKPNVAVPTGETKELVLAPNARGTFSRRRAVLEQMHRKREEVTQTSPFIAQVSEQARATVKDVTLQSVEAVEAELGLINEHGDEVKTNAS